MAPQLTPGLVPVEALSEEDSLVASPPPARSRWRLARAAQVLAIAGALVALVAVAALFRPPRAGAPGSLPGLPGLISRAKVQAQVQVQVPHELPPLPLPTTGPAPAVPADPARPGEPGANGTNETGNASEGEAGERGEQTGPLIARCVVDAIQATAYLGTAVVSIRRAKVSCPFQTLEEDEKMECAVSVGEIVMALASIASFLSLSASSCQGSLVLPALCATDMSALVADLADIASAGALVAGSCNSGPDEITYGEVYLNESTGRQEALPSSEFNAKRGRAHGRRRRHHPLRGVAGAVSKVNTAMENLASKATKALHLGNGTQEGNGNGTLTELLADFAARQSKEEEQVDRNYEIAQCVFNANNLLGYIVRAILQIREAALHCPKEEACWVDIVFIVTCFARIAEFISRTVAECTVGGMRAAFCAAGISDLVAAVTDFTSSVGAARIDCGEQKPETADAGDVPFND